MLCVVILLMAQAESSVLAQTPTTDRKESASLARYVDQQSGLTADDLVAYALEHNLELQAMKKEIDAAKALVKQARLRANPKVDLSVSQNVTGNDRNIDADTTTEIRTAVSIDDTMMNSRLLPVFSAAMPTMSTSPM